MSEQPAKDNYTTDGIHPTYKNKYERRIKSMMWPVDALTKILNEVEAEESKDDSAVAYGHVGPPPEHVDAVMADPTFEPNE